MNGQVAHQPPHLLPSFDMVKEQVVRLAALVLLYEYSLTSVVFVVSSAAVIFTALWDPQSVIDPITFVIWDTLKPF